MSLFTFQSSGHLVAANAESSEIMDIPLSWCPHFNSLSDKAFVSIPRYGHMCSLETIIFFCPDIDSIVVFKTTFNEGLFDLQINGMSILTFSLSLLMNLKEVSQSTQNTYTIHLPSMFTLPSIALTILQYSEVEIYVRVPNPQRVRNIKIGAKFMNLPSFQQQQLLLDNNVQYSFQQIERVEEIESSPLYQEFRWINMSNNDSKGCFLEGDWSKLDSLTFTFGSDESITWQVNRGDISPIHPISDRLLYFSYSGENDYQSMHLTTLALNTNVLLKLRFTHTNLSTEEEINGRFKMYSLVIKSLVYIDGLANLNSTPTMLEINFHQFSNLL